MTLFAIFSPSAGCLQQVHWLLLLLLTACLTNYGAINTLDCLESLTRLPLTAPPVFLHLCVHSISEPSALNLSKKGRILLPSGHTGHLGVCLMWQTGKKLVKAKTFWLKQLGRKVDCRWPKCASRNSSAIDFVNCWARCQWQQGLH